MNIEKHFPTISKFTDETTPGIRAHANSPKGLCVPQVIADFGNLRARIADFPHIGYSMIRCLRESFKSYSFVNKRKYHSRKEISEIELERIKTVAESYGISTIGFTTVDPTLIFKDRMVMYPNAIVFLMEMKEEPIQEAPSVNTIKEIFRTYKGLGVAVNKIADEIRRLGFNAQPNPAIGGDCNYPLLAEKAGLGVVGKHGLLISEEFGPSVRIAAIYTDIENLPINDSNSHEWIHDFCEKCDRCVKKCPAQAIYPQAVKTESGKQCVDYKKCAIPFSNDHGCTVCVKECTFFRQDYHKIKENFLK